MAKLEAEKQARARAATQPNPVRTQIPGMNVDIVPQNPQQAGNMGMGPSANQNQIRTSIPGGAISQQQQQQASSQARSVGFSSTVTMASSTMVTSGGFQSQPSNFAGQVHKLIFL